MPVATKKKFAASTVKGETPARPKVSAVRKKATSGVARKKNTATSKTSARKRTVRVATTKPIIAENLQQAEEVIIIEKKSIWHMPVRFDHSVLAIASFTMVFTSIMLVSFGSNAQYQASVTAVVLPSPENTRVAQKNFWEKMDPYQQLTAASAAGLGVLMLGAGAIFTQQHRRRPAQ